MAGAGTNTYRYLKDGMEGEGEEQHGGAEATVLMELTLTSKKMEWKKKARSLMRERREQCWN
jgi:hypothetical protein